MEKQRTRIKTKIAWRSTLLAMEPGDIIEQVGINEYNACMRIAVYLKKNNLGRWTVNIKDDSITFSVTRIL